MHTLDSFFQFRRIVPGDNETFRMLIARRVVWQLRGSAEVHSLHVRQVGEPGPYIPLTEDVVTHPTFDAFLQSL